MTKLEQMKEIAKANPDFGKRVGYKMCVIDELHDIKELEKENALLKGRNEGFEQQIMGLLIKYEEVYNRFPDLKSAMDKAKAILKENAELKEQNRKLLESCEGATMMYKDLCKAKELIKRLMHELVISNRPYDEIELLVKDVEQFLNSEVGK